MATSERHYSKLDQLIGILDQSIRVLTHTYTAPQRANPAAAIAELPLSLKERKHSAGLMRVNHVGEICAQALYLGQSLTAHTSKARTAMQQAALEENDHLNWCYERLEELNSRPSYLNLFWYSHSLLLGIAAGIAGDPWSLGFIVETERQVIAHLEEHLQDLPQADQKSRQIVIQMRSDEAHHASQAAAVGARKLPYPVKLTMRCLAKVMTTIAYWF